MSSIDVDPVVDAGKAEPYPDRAAGMAGCATIDEVLAAVRSLGARRGQLGFAMDGRRHQGRPGRGPRPGRVLEPPTRRPSFRRTCARAAAATSTGPRSGWRCRRGRACGAAEALHCFAARDSMDIERLGDTIIRGLVTRGLVVDPADLYHLDVETLSQLDRLGRTSARRRSIARVAATADGDR